MNDNSEEIIEGYRLSPQQRRLWQWMGCAGAAFHSSVALTVNGRVDALRLRDAWNKVVGRHEAMRTSFRFVPGLDFPVQVINEAPVGLDEYVEIDCGACESGSERCATAEQEWSQLQARNLNAETGPTWRAQVVRCGSERCELSVSASALCADQRTLRNVVEEWLRCYQATTIEGEPVQYVQFSEWQHEVSTSDEAERVHAQVTAGVESTLQLPEERAVQQLGHYLPAQVAVEIDAESARRLRSLAGARNAGLSDVLEAAWRILLWRLAGEGDVMLARSFAGRTYDELAPAFGLFEKYIPVHTYLTGSLRFDEVLEKVRKTVAAAGEWQDYWTGEPVTEDKLVENGVRVGFDYHTWTTLPHIEGLECSLSHCESYTERFKLRLSATDVNNDLQVRLHYDPEFYTTQTAARFANAFSVVSSSLVAEPQAQISGLDILGEREMRRVLVEWNDTASEFPAGLCTHELFAAQAAKTPYDIALICEGEELTYCELDDRTNQLAHHLIAIGVGPEKRVGLLLERSPEMVIALLATLKSGGAYVPLDPQYPAERLSFILEDAGIDVLVTQSRLVETIPNYTGRIVCLDVEKEAIESESGAPVPNAAAPEDLAYVIYTSGSTGKPKGVMIEHRSLVNLAHALQQSIYNKLSPGLCVGLNAPFGFDASVKQIAQLLHGHTLCVIPEDMRLDSASFISYLADKQIDVLDCTPSQLRWLLADGLDQRTDLALHTMLIGGEAIEPAMWQQLQQSRIDFFNVYGPTECCVDTTTAAIKQTGARPTIGRPLPNVRVYVLNENYQPVLPGMAGEICVGGAGVGRGYLNRPGLTAEKFIPDPISKEPGARLYRTGDLGSYLDDGTIVYAGRIDRQVKVHGFRIELEEIESALEDHPAVKDCAVVVRTGETGDSRLVAYVVTLAGQDSNGNGLPRHRLPNGLLIAYQNRNEADDLYNEIFKDRIYLKHGIKLPQGACVVDAGANIGLFTMFVTQHCPDARVYAFEPVKPVYEKLAINATLCGTATKIFNYGLSNLEKTETFAYYPRYTAKSGVSDYADALDEVEVVKTFLRNQQQFGVTEVQGLIEVENELLNDLFESESQECLLKRLSDVIREEAIERIDLLKVDVQRAELDVLNGLDADDWSKIQQLVMEVHDRKGKATGGRIEQITRLLQEHGFDVIVEQDKFLIGTDRYNLYAARHKLHRNAETNGNGHQQFDFPTSVAADLDHGALQQFLKKRMPDYMVPGVWVMLDKLPLTRHGKVDYLALPAPEEVQARDQKELAPPRTPTEEIVVAIWAEVLGVKEVSADGNFFELGGHSLMATQVIARLRKAFNIELTLRSFFREPTVSGLAAFIDETMRSQLSLNIPPLTRISRDGELPLSFAQQRLWFLHQWEPSSSLYNSSASLRIGGRLNVPALRRTLQEIVARHESLRTSFVAVDGVPSQRIAESLLLPLPVVDLSELPEADRQQVAKSLAQQDALRPFDLANGPLLRITLLRLFAEEHVVLYTMHHIISDGWSMSVVGREVAALYEAFSEGRPSPLAELPLQYADYAVWQRNYLQGEVLEKQLDFWRKYLSDAPAMLAVPTDRPRPRVQTFNGASYKFELSEDLSEGLRALSRREGTTLFMTLLACWQTLLWRYTAQDQISVGTGIANRTRREVEPLIGFFVNTLVLKTDFAGNPTFTELLKRVREMCLDTYAHQDVPFERLIEELQPERSTTHSPLFQVMFVLHNEPAGALELRGLKLTSGGGGHSPAKFDLRLSLMETGAGGVLKATLTYNTDLFDRETAARMSAHFRTLVERIVAAPGERVSELPLSTPQEEKRLVSEWIGERVEFAPPVCLHELFERQAQADPEALAVICESERLTYEQLNQRANQLAHHLGSLGVGPEVRVAILLDLSLDTVVSVMAILKAGGAYLGLDPSWPAQRLAFILQDAGARLLLTDSALFAQSGLGELPAQQNSCRVLCLDQERDAFQNLPTTSPGPSAAPDNLAYLIYTSGSTGQPKAVMGEHRQVVNYVLAAAKRLGLGAGSYAVQQSLAVDAPVTYLFAALALGGVLHTLPREVVADVDRLGTYIRRRRIDYFKIAPSHLAALLADETQPEAVLPRRVLLVGGEALGRGLAEKALTADGCNVVNHYGPTETTVGVLTHHVTANTEAGVSAGSIVCLDEPLANTSVYILDRMLRPSPIGVPGEIYIGGAGVARGYLNRPELTAERFLPDSFTSEAGRRLYRTGDLGRRKANGEIEFLGRMDHQVKVRGFRVEVEEIETQLEAHPAVQSAVIEARRDGRGETRLVCYLVWAAGAIDAIDESRESLRTWILARLPDYMIPTAWIELSELPRTPQGKVDRRALPTPDWTTSTSSAEYEEPADDVERQVASVFARLLAVERVGAADNFFELGGHSLLATRAVSQLRKDLGVEVGLREFFEQPTVRKLSHILRERLQTKVEVAPEAIQIVRAKREGRRVQRAALEAEEVTYEI